MGGLTVLHSIGCQTFINEVWTEYPSQQTTRSLLGYGAYRFRFFLEWKDRKVCVLVTGEHKSDASDWMQTNAKKATGLPKSAIQWVDYVGKD
jgi:hypothetical protein